MGVFGRWGILAVCCVAFMALFPQNLRRDSLLSDIASGKTRVLDLSYAINDKLVPWPGDTRWFEAKVNATVEKNGYFTRSFWMLEHYGTHLDAPVHFPPGKTPVDQIPAKQFFGPAVVLDVRAEGAKNPDYQLPAARVEDWENKHGQIVEGAIVLLRTGWAARWPDARRYRNQDAQGRMHFPGFSADSVKLLIKRKISGIGCDTMSADYGASEDFAVHHLALGAGLYQLENLADLSEVPEAGAFLVVAPIKLEGGSGGPVRVYALIGAGNKEVARR
jgi:kynurenine formamidase